MKLYGYYLDPVTEAIDSFCHELLVYWDKISYWPRFIDLRHNLAVLRPNMGKTEFFEWTDRLALSLWSTHLAYNLDRTHSRMLF